MADSSMSFRPASQTILGPETETARTEQPVDSGVKRYSIVTLLPFLLTALTFLATFTFQVYQNRQQNRFQQLQQQAQQDATIDSEWRKALEQLQAKDGSSAAVGAYEMVSFSETQRYRDQALAIVPTLLSKIDNPLTFDVILFDINPHINQENQNQLIALDTMLTRDLTELYGKIANSKSFRKDRSFATFLQEPEQFIDDNHQSELLKQALTQIWELDSVSSALSHNWRGDGLGAKHPTPRDQDLSGGVVFLNNDWRGIDFREANLEGAAFFGKCKIDKTTVFPLSVRAKFNCL